MFIHEFAIFLNLIIADTSQSPQTTPNPFEADEFLLNIRKPPEEDVFSIIKSAANSRHNLHVCLLL